MPINPQNIIVSGSPLEACLTAIVLKVQLGNAVNVCLKLKQSRHAPSIQASHCDAHTASQLQKMGVNLGQLLKSGAAEFALGVNHQHVNSTKNVFLPFGRYGATINKKPFYLSYLEHIKNLDGSNSINNYSLAYQLAHANSMGFSSDQASPLSELEYCYTLKHDAITPALIAYAQSIKINTNAETFNHNIDLKILIEGLENIVVTQKNNKLNNFKDHISLQHTGSHIAYAVVTGSTQHIQTINTSQQNTLTYAPSPSCAAKVLHLKNSHLGLCTKEGFISTHINISTLIADNIIINNTIDIPIAYIEHELLKIQKADAFMLGAIAYLFNNKTATAQQELTSAIEHALELFESCAQTSHIIPQKIKPYWPYFCILVAEQKSKNLPTASHPISVPIQYIERIKHIFSQTTAQCTNYKNFKHRLIGGL